MDSNDDIFIWQDKIDKSLYHIGFKFGKKYRSEWQLNGDTLEILFGCDLKKLKNPVLVSLKMEFVSL